MYFISQQLQETLTIFNSIRLLTWFSNKTWWQYLYLFSPTVPFATARQCQTNITETALSKLCFSKLYKYQQLVLIGGYRPKLVTATDTKANLTWTLYIPFACWQISRHLSLLTGVTQRARQKLPRRARWT